MADEIQAGNEEEDGKLANLSHKDICEYVRGELNDVLKDPLLRYLPHDPTSEEINSRIALEKGKAIVLKLKRLGPTTSPGETEEILCKFSNIFRADDFILNLKFT